MLLQNDNKENRKGWEKKITDINFVRLTYTHGNVHAVADATPYKRIFLPACYSETDPIAHAQDKAGMESTLDV